MSGHCSDMDQNTDRTFTPATAAKHAKCGRTSIMRALQNKELLGDRDNRNRWKISLQSLEKWMKTRPDTDRRCPVSVQASGQDQARSETWTQLAAAEATIEELRSRITDNDQRHETEIARLERIIDRFSAPKPSLIHRIFGAPDRS